MAIYFCTGTATNINAITGVKSIVIKSEIATRLDKSLDEVLECTSCSKDLADTLNSQLKEQLNDDDLREEYRHFQCLAWSKVGGLIHLSNIFLRHAYSQYTRRADLSDSISPNPLFREVMGYYYRYALFHRLAAPLIEAHHQVLEGKKEFPERLSYLYGSDAERAMNLLSTVADGDGEGGENLHKSVAVLIDRRFYDKSFSPGGNRQSSPEGSDRPLNSLETIRITNHIVMPTLGFTKAWPLLMKVAGSKLQIIKPYLLARIFPKSSKRIAPGQLPGILSHCVTIDPVGFPLGIKATRGIELPFETPIQKGRSDLLWHLLSYCAVSDYLLKNGVPIGMILNYFRMLRGFHEKWAGTATGRAVQVGEMDNGLLLQISGTEPCERTQAVLLRLALETFSVWLKRFESLPGDDVQDVYRLLNRFYMHV